MAKLKIKSRKERIAEYNEKYSAIPYKFNEILKYLQENLKISDKEINNIKKDALIELETSKIFLVLYEIPLPYMRGRITPMKTIYTPLAKENSDFMSDYIEKTLNEFKKIYTPMKIKGVFYLPTPNYFNKKEKILAELGVIRPITVPDVDNIAKGYLDAFNSNLFLDDALIQDLTVSKYYSAKPRVEMTIEFLTRFNSNKQMKSLLSSKKFLDSLPENLVIEVSEQITNGNYYNKEEREI